MAGGGSDLLTIKKFAEMAGKSQQGIYKQLPTRLAPYTHEVDGQKFVEKRALSEVFGIEVDGLNNQTEADSKVDFDPNTLLYTLMKDELEEKNELIKRLQAENEKLQEKLEKEREHSRSMSEELLKLADQAQKLHAGSMQQQQIQAPDPERPAEQKNPKTEAEVVVETVEQSTKKKGFFAGLKGLFG